MTRLHYLTIFISGPYIVQGKYGNAIFTPNTGSLNDKVINLGTHENDCLGNLALCPNGVTLSLWFKVDDPFSWPIMIYSTHFIFAIERTSGGLKLKSHSKSMTHEITYHQLSTIKTNIWTHFALTYTTNSGYEFFQDGCKLTKQNPVIRPMTPVIRNFELGCANGANCMKIAYDDFKFWSTAKDEQFMWWLANG